MTAGIGHFQGVLIGWLGSRRCRAPRGTVTEAAGSLTLDPRHPKSNSQCASALSSPTAAFINGALGDDFVHKDVVCVDDQVIEQLGLITESDERAIGPHAFQEP